MSLDTLFDDQIRFAQGKYEAIKFALDCNLDTSSIKAEIEKTKVLLDSGENEATLLVKKPFYEGYHKGLAEALDAINRPTDLQVYAPTGMLAHTIESKIRLSGLPLDGLIEAFEFVKSCRGDINKLKQEIAEREAGIIRRVGQGTYTLSDSPVVYQLSYLAGLKQALYLLTNLNPE